jgi:hypothetical protein
MKFSWPSPGAPLRLVMSLGDVDSRTHDLRPRSHEARQAPCTDWTAAGAHSSDRDIESAVLRTIGRTASSRRFRGVDS